MARCTCYVRQDGVVYPIYVADRRLAIEVTLARTAAPLWPTLMLSFLCPQIPGHDIYDAIHVYDNVGEEWGLEELLAHKAFISTCMVKVSFCLLRVNRSNPIAQPEACRSWTVRSSCTMTPTHRSCWCSTGTKRSSCSRSCFRGAAKNGFTPKRDEMALHLFFFLIKAL